MYASGETGWGTSYIFSGLQLYWGQSAFIAQSQISPLRKLKENFASSVSSVSFASHPWWMRRILSPRLNSPVFSAHPGFPIFSGRFSIEKQICINGETEGGGGGDTWRVLFLSEEEVWIEWVSLSFLSNGLKDGRRRVRVAILFKTFLK